MNVRDLIIIGSGPAALTAAIYASRANLSTEVFECKSFGGALTEIAHIGNFPGFTGEGIELAKSLKAQAESFGATLSFGECTSVKPAKPTNSSADKNSAKKPLLEAIIDGEPRLARAVIVATGTAPRHLDFDSPIPVSYCAVCDAPLYKGKNIIVIGGGNSAIQESIHLATIVNQLTLVSHSNLTAEPSNIEKLRALKNVKIRENTEPTSELLADFDAAFVFIGKCPATYFLNKSLLAPSRAIKTDENNMSALPGLFAAGDVREGTIKQAVTAAADGAVAALHVRAYLSQ